MRATESQDKNDPSGLGTNLYSTMNNDLNLSAYNYNLPQKCIAQHPADKRDDSKLMVLSTIDNTVRHQHFDELTGFLNENDMLVINDTKVFPARLVGKKETGGKVEVFLLEFPKQHHNNSNSALATALIKASKKPQKGSVITINSVLSCTVTEELGHGKVNVELHYDPQTGLAKSLQQSGQVPLPPYILRKNGSTQNDINRYQTVYASQPGAVAAPTAGLHFTKKILENLAQRGILVSHVTLHVGYGTFAPVRKEDITRHQIHKEYLSIPEETVQKIKETKLRGGKIWAVGTTTVRALEYGALATGKLTPTQGWCDLYIYPGFQFKVIDNLITNFHLPNSSLMFLVSALCGRKTLLDCYNNAIKENYRFFSYGDAMAIITAP